MINIKLYWYNLVNSFTNIYGIVEDEYGDYWVQALSDKWTWLDIVRGVNWGQKVERNWYGRWVRLSEWRTDFIVSDINII